jgi:hypothetical protein
VSTGDLLYVTRAATIALALLGIMVGAAELGFRIGRRQSADREAEAQLAAIEAALLGLLALLLGFTFSLSATRYEARKEIVVAEANAISTAYNCAELLPAAEGAPLREQLRTYVDARLAFYGATPHEPASDAAEHATRRLQRSLWSDASRIGRARPQYQTVTLLLRALNETFDVEARQAAAFDDFVPVSVQLLVFIASIIGIGSVGYFNGTKGYRHLVLTTFLAVMCALTIFVILDLDRPRRGFIRITRTPLLELRDFMRETRDTPD